MTMYRTACFLPHTHTHTDSYPHNCVCECAYLSVTQTSLEKNKHSKQKKKVHYKKINTLIHTWTLTRHPPDYPHIDSYVNRAIKKNAFTYSFVYEVSLLPSHVWTQGTEKSELQLTHKEEKVTDARPCVV